MSCHAGNSIVARRLCFGDLKEHLHTCNINVNVIIMSLKILKKSISSQLCETDILKTLKCLF